MKFLHHVKPPEDSAKLADHPAIKNANDIAEERTSVTEKICQRIATATGAPLTLVIVIVFQLVWIVFGHVTKMDPFPFTFMLTISNVVQLILIVVVAVAGKQQSTHDSSRADADHAALSRMLYHQQVQETLLLHIAEKVQVDTSELHDTISDLAEGQIAAPGMP